MSEVPRGNLHYQATSGVCPHCAGQIQVVDLMLDQPGWVFNAVKYIVRAGHKGNFVGDAGSCLWYIARRLRRAGCEQLGLELESLSSRVSAWQA